MDDSLDYTDKPNKWLFEIIAGDKPQSPRHVAAKYELERRAGRRARIVSWISIGVALLSLGISLLKQKDVPSHSIPDPVGRYTFTTRNDSILRGDTVTGEAVMLIVVEGKPKIVPLFEK